MLSRIFNNSKPVILISLLILTSFWFWTYASWEILINKHSSIISILSNWIILLCVLFVFDFINKKNKINHKNSYSILSLIALILSIPEVFNNISMWLSSLIYLLVIRRVINLQTTLNIKKKIFEASIWLFFASLYEPFLAFGYIIIFIAILFFVPQNYKNFFIPLFGFTTSYIIYLLYNLLFYNNWFLLSDLFSTINLNFNHFFLEKNIYINIIYGLLVIFCIFRSSTLLNKSKGNKRISFILLYFFMLLGILNIFNSTENLEEKLIFIFLPLSFLLGKNIQLVNKKMLKETIVWGIILLPTIKLAKLLI